jgi:hypothetical protein
MGLCDQLDRKYDDTSLWEICHRLGIPSGKEREILLDVRG